MNAATVKSVSQEWPIESEIKGKVEKKAGKRVGYNYIIVKSYKESQKNDVVKCLYIKSLTNFGFCVIKEGTYGDTRDKHGRDIIDRLVWQRQLHETLQSKVRIPRLLGSFEENGNYYLVIEHIKGKPFYKICYEKKRELRDSITNGGKIGQKFLGYLEQIAGILQTLHQNQIVHRDATANNFMITPAGKVAIIDVELSYSVQNKFPLPAFQLGTYGYMSPQQEATEIPTTEEDIFAMGAIVIQVWTSISASKLAGDSLESLTRKVRFFIPDQEIANIVIQCLDPNPEKRPSAASIRQVLHQYKTDSRYKVPRPTFDPVFFSKKEILQTIQQTIGTLASSLMADSEKGWFADNMKPPVDVDRHKLNKMWYASFNRGDSGIIYLLTQAQKVGLNIDVTLPYIQKGIMRIKRKYIDRIEDVATSLHFGSDGIAAVLATAITQGLLEHTPEYIEWIDQLLEKESESFGILQGVEGQGIANFIAKSFISSQKLQERLHRYAQFLLGKQQSDGSWIHGFYKHKLMKIKMKKATRGFGDGMAGTVYFLLEYARCYQHADSLNAAERGLKWFIKKAVQKNDKIQWLSSRNKQLGHWWTEGTCGIALAFIKAWQVTNKPIYKQYAIEALDSIPVTVMDNNLSQANGLSGLGEVYLEAWDVLKEDRWLQRAGWIAQVIMHLKKQHVTYGPYWLVEHERQPTANFMVGNSGVLHFLLRYCYPDKIQFPLLPGNAG